MLAIKNLFRRKLRTALCVIGVAVGVASVVAFTSISEGLRQSITDYCKKTGAQIMVYKKGVAGMDQSHIKSKEIDKVRNVSTVESVSRAVVVVSRFPTAPGLFIFGRDPSERLIRMYSQEELRGRLLEKEDEVMVGEILASTMRISVGDTVPLSILQKEGFPKELKVVGIFKTGISFENGACVAHINLTTLAKGWPLGDCSVIFVYLKNPALTSQTIQEIQGVLPACEVTPVSEIVKNFESQLSYVDKFVWIISLAALLVGCVGVLNTLLMSITERTREIGTLRAIGWSRGKVVAMIINEAFIISALGGLVGAMMGVVGAEWLIRLVPQGFLGVSYSLGTFAKGLVVALVMGSIGAIYPAFRASLLQPAEALRYE